MKRRLLIVLLGFGTVFGFTTGFASMSHRWHDHAEQRRAAFEAHVADICVDAAHRADTPPPPRYEEAPRYQEPPPGRYQEPPPRRWQEPPSDYPDWDRPEHHHHRRHRFDR